MKVGLLATLLVVSMVVSAGLGDAHLSVRQVVAALSHGPRGQSFDGIIVWHIRLPRIVLAALAGAGLAAAGLAFQCLLRNDLADPYVIGVSSGASVGAQAVMLFGDDAWLGGAGVSLAAFASALAVLVVVYFLARRRGQVQVTALLLSGVVVSAFLGSISALMLQLGPPMDTAHVLGRLMGSFQDAEWPQCVVLGVFLVFGLLVLSLQTRAMDVLSLGEESAQQLGVETERLKSVLMATGALLTAAAVAVSGIIGFVGLMVPHMARRLAGTPRHGRVLPLAALGGAILLVWSDTLARWAVPGGRELPAGIVTALLGAPFFLRLLRRQLKGS